MSKEFKCVCQVSDIIDKPDIRLEQICQRIVDIMGGIRVEQSFYLKKESDTEYLCASLWPWHSDPSKITLKIRKGDFNDV